MNYFDNQHLNEAGFAYYLNKENAEKDIYLELQSHIESCEKCNFEYQELNDLMLEINHTDIKKVAKLNILLRYAAVLVLLYSSYLIYQQSTEQFVYGENFKYENMIDDELRSKKILKTPESTTYLKSKALFEFDTATKNAIEVIIVSVDDQTILRKKVQNNKVEFFANEFTKGVYYWKIETESDILKVGKFIVD